MRIGILIWVLMLEACNIYSADSSPLPDASPPTSGPIACGRDTCTGDQLCVTISAGSQCGVNEDAGIGPYGIITQYCAARPAACDETVTCGCAMSACHEPSGDYPPCWSVSDDQRNIGCGCF